MNDATTPCCVSSCPSFLLSPSSCPFLTSPFSDVSLFFSAPTDSFLFLLHTDSFLFLPSSFHDEFVSSFRSHTESFLSFKHHTDFIRINQFCSGGVIRTLLDFLLRVQYQHLLSLSSSSSSSSSSPPSSSLLSPPSFFSSLDTAICSLVYFGCSRIETREMLLSSIENSHFLSFLDSLTPPRSNCIALLISLNSNFHFLFKKYIVSKKSPYYSFLSSPFSPFKEEDNMERSQMRRETGKKKEMEMGMEVGMEKEMEGEKKMENGKEEEKKRKRKRKLETEWDRDRKKKGECEKETERQRARDRGRGSEKERNVFFNLFQDKTMPKKAMLLPILALFFSKLNSSPETESFYCLLHSVLSFFLFCNSFSLSSLCYSSTPSSKTTSPKISITNSSHSFSSHFSPHCHCLFHSVDPHQYLQIHHLCCLHSLPLTTNTMTANTRNNDDPAATTPISQLIRYYFHTFLSFAIETLFSFLTSTSTSISSSVLSVRTATPILSWYSHQSLITSYTLSSSSSNDISLSFLPFSFFPVYLQVLFMESESPPFSSFLHSTVFHSSTFLLR